MSLPTTPVTPSPAPDTHHAEPEFDLLTWLELNRKPLLLLLGAVSVAIVVTMVIRHQQRQSEAAANAALLALLPPVSQGDAVTPPKADDLIKLADANAGSSTAARARLVAAGRLYSEGKYAESRAQFEQFERDFPESPLVGSALLGIAASLDAENKTNEAVLAYQRVISTHGTEPVAAHAKLAKARLHEASGQVKEAFALYDEVQRNPISNSTLQTAAMARARLAAANPDLDKPLVSTNAVNVVAPPPATPGK